MTKSKLISITSSLLLILFNLDVAAAEVEARKDAGGSFLDFIKIRKSSSVGNEADTQLPASFQLVIPSSEKNSYSIDIGISRLSLYEPSERFSLSLGSEYHKNNLIDSEQDTLIVGLGGNALYFDSSEGIGLEQSFTVSYKNDDIGSGSGIFLKTVVVPVSEALGTAGEVPLIIGKFEIGEFNWLPHIGLQYETGDNVFKTGASGSTGRFNGGIEASITPFPKFFEDRIKVTGSLSYWSELGASQSYLRSFGRDQSLFGVLVSFYFDESKKFSGGIEYSDGAEPEQGRLEQKIFTVKLQLELG